LHSTTRARKRVSASAGAAACAGQSLKDGFDYAGSVNSLQFGLKAQPIHTVLVSTINTMVVDASSDGELVDGVAFDGAAFVGGVGCLPGLRHAVLEALGEDTDVLPSEPTETLTLCSAV
jgi:heat shock protein 1/8